MAEDRVDIAADGTAIGELGGLPPEDGVEREVRPAVFDEETGNVARLEIVMSPDAVLRGEGAVSPEALEVILPKYSDQKLRVKAVELYVSGKYSLHDIADSLDVPDRTVARWAEEGNWIAFSERMVDTLRKHEKARIAIKRIQEREKAINEQIELGHKIAEAGKEFIENAETAGQFKVAAEGVKLGSDMVGRALAISETGKVDADSAKSGDDDRRTPLVAVIANGGLPPIRVVADGREEALDAK